MNIEIYLRYVLKQIVFKPKLQLKRTNKICSENYIIINLKCKYDFM
jgi:hypothetical protein